MLIGHLSDLHVRDEGDVIALAHQLDRIAADGASHLVITGDLLDRWRPALLHRALEVLDARGFLAADRCTILHGNHDLASSGGHPRNRADLLRLALRFWDPPPLIHVRRRRFYDLIARRAPGVASEPPFQKTLPGGLRLAAIDSVPVPWRPFALVDGRVTVTHAIGECRPSDLTWLSSLPEASPTVVLMHHYPLDAPTFSWTASGVLRRFVRHVDVPMAIEADGRRRFWRVAKQKDVRLVLCGHVHRARFERHDGIAVGLNGQSGAEWAGRTIAYYEISADGIRARTIASDQKR